MQNQIERNLLALNQKINNACKTYERKLSDINLVAVSKTVTTENILAAIKSGCKIFGENYVKEAQEKWPAIKQNHPQIKLHLIGHLQSNKASEAVALFDCIESLDSEKLAKELQKEIVKVNQGQNEKNLRNNDKISNQNAIILSKIPKIFIQINIGEEQQKSGIAPHAAHDFINFARNECKLNVIGLMCVPPTNEEPSSYFALLAKIAKENNLKKLSMGMSADFPEAIALGATHIRVGTAIFGER